MTTLNTSTKPAISSNGLLYAVPVWKLHQEHEEELKRVMEATGTSFRKWNGKAFWELANECGHTSLDFKLCACRKA